MTAKDEAKPTEPADREGASGDAKQAVKDEPATDGKTATAVDVLTDDRTAEEEPAAPQRRWSKWYWVVARGAATAVIGVAAILLGVVVLPKFADTDISANRAPETPASSSPGNQLPGGPLPEGFTDPSPTATPLPKPTGPVQTQRGRPADALSTWAVNLSDLGIPQVALQAYGYAETVVSRTQPNCHLSWTLLAGIGAVESNHGRHGGANLLADGSSQPKIVGVQLSGATTERITDTDQGKLDGDPQFDRAVGAMQFIPATWKTWAVDADNDGKADPYDLDDAALSAAYYLCAGGRDLGTGSGWWSAVLSYNNLTPYATKVYAEADRYGRNSTG